MSLIRSEAYYYFAAQAGKKPLHFSVIFNLHLVTEYVLSIVSLLFWEEVGTANPRLLRQGSPQMFWKEVILI